MHLEIKEESLYITKNKKELSQTEENTVKPSDCSMASASLSRIVKGSIAEDRIKEYILFHGQDLLNVYKPVIDKNGVDFIVMQNSFYHPIYLQIKSRYYPNFENKETEIFISENTFTSHTNFFIVCSYFNFQTPEMLEDLLFIPSEIAEQRAVKEDGKLRLSLSFSKDEQNIWKQHLVNKTQLIDKILDEFVQMSKYLK